ncbi:hypothetical protein DEFDS_P237 (plasmid) [Deferribacter desulfuricans SSM1]|uniref:Uncharacterized protein n=1 Tax=Deferribacter desulfuricans (strain DSM 14783 / JCM 11476 / NBRC 101012 / SSM1) TaxID=639282 RepID=D3PF65_DEFDS|nr:hypothetical protein [Deferribacter desulfuricans]BAI81857.1 hypothetical protein DEFDS_P237 [Deferribacter desulfuricans SSM1]
MLKHTSFLNLFYQYNNIYNLYKNNHIDGEKLVNLDFLKRKNLLTSDKLFALNDFTQTTPMIDITEAFQHILSQKSNQTNKDIFTDIEKNQKKNSNKSNNEDKNKDDNDENNDEFTVLINDNNEENVITTGDTIETEDMMIVDDEVDNAEDDNYIFPEFDIDDEEETLINKDNLENVVERLSDINSQLLDNNIQKINEETSTQKNHKINSNLTEDNDLEGDDSIIEKDSLESKSDEFSDGFLLDEKDEDDDASIFKIDDEEDEYLEEDDQVEDFAVLDDSLDYNEEEKEAFENSQELFNDIDIEHLNTKITDTKNITSSNNKIDSVHVEQMNQEKSDNKNSINVSFNTEHNIQKIDTANLDITNYPVIIFNDKKIGYELFLEKDSFDHKISDALIYDFSFKCIKKIKEENNCFIYEIQILDCNIGNNYTEQDTEKLKELLKSKSIYYVTYIVMLENVNYNAGIILKKKTSEVTEDDIKLLKYMIDRNIQTFFIDTLTADLIKIHELEELKQIIKKIKRKGSEIILES